MIKLLIKLALAALIANACWRLGSAYATFYRFKDAVEQSAQFGGARTEDELKQRVLDLATEYDIPLTADGFTIRRGDNHTYIDGEYTQPIDIAPGYTKPWTFRWNIDTLTAAGRNPPR